MAAFLDDVEAAARSAVQAYEDTRFAGAAAEIANRLREPLRVAIAGRVKAGKSTLLNALVGQQLAATDAGECTRVVTWYRDGLTYRCVVEPREGAPKEVPLERDDDGVLRIDLHGRPPEDIERITVDWPSASLRAMTLIDTPGIASLTASSSERSLRFLASDDDQPTAAEAVVYLMRHVHMTDVRFLEAFHDEEVSRATPVNAVGVLSRADEIGVARLDAMESAGRIAERYRSDPRIRRLCQTVVPVSALLGQAGATLREDEFGQLSELAKLPPTTSDALVLSTDRFTGDSAAAGVGRAERARLLERLGLFGIRLSIAAIRRGARTAPDLAAELFDASGLGRLQEALTVQLAARRDALKARAALVGLEAIVRADPGRTAELAGELERIRANAHELAEMRLLSAIREGSILREGEIEPAERLLGAAGAAPAVRLGLPEDAGEADIRALLGESLARWQKKAENPLASPAEVQAARILARTCEGLFGELAAVRG